MPAAAGTFVMSPTPTHLPENGRGPFTRVRWSPCGRYLAAASSDGTVSLWDGAPPYRPLARLEGHTGPVLSVAWSPATRYLASASADRWVLVWEAGAWSAPRARLPHPGEVYDAAFHPGDDNILATSGLDRKVRVADLTRLPPAGDGDPSRTVVEHRRGVDCVIWSPDGGKLVSCSAAGDVKFSDPQTGAAGPVYTRLTTNTVHHLLWRAGLVLVGTGDGTIRFVSPKAKAERRVLGGHADEVTGLALSHDGAFLASRALDGQVLVRRCDTWDIVRRVESTPSALDYSWRAGVDFHPQRHLLTTLDEGDTRVRVEALDPAGLRERLLLRSQVWLTAKVVLLGPPGVGKSGLACRLAGEPWRRTTPTHGAALRAVAPPHGYRHPRVPEEASPRLILWDFAGQPVHHLVHQLFLDQCQAALLLTDGGKKGDPFHGVAEWSAALRRLSPRARRVLVLSKTDVSPPTADAGRIEEFVARHGLAGPFATSARKNTGVEEILHFLWNNLDFTEAHWPAAQAQLREAILGIQNHGFRNQSNPPVVLLDELMRELADGPGDGATKDLKSVLRQMDALGELVYVENPEAPGASVVVLRRDVLDLCATAVLRLVDEDGAVDEGLVRAGTSVRVPRVSLHDHLWLVRATVDLLLRREVCFRDRGKLVFPSAIRTAGEGPDASPRRPAADIDFGVCVEQTYAKLVVRAHRGEFGAFRFAGAFRHEVRLASPEPGAIAAVALVPGGEGAATLSVVGNGLPPAELADLINRVHQHALEADDRAKLRLRHYCPNPDCREEVVDHRAIDKAKENKKPALPCQFCGYRVPVLGQVWDIVRAGIGAGTITEEEADMSWWRKINWFKAISGALEGLGTHPLVKGALAFFSVVKEDLQRKVNDAVAETFESPRGRPEDVNRVFEKLPGRPGPMGIKLAEFGATFARDSMKEGDTEADLAGRLKQRLEQLAGRIDNGAGDLRDRLATYFDTVQVIQRLLTDAGIPLGDVSLQGPAVDVWYSTLRYLRGQDPLLAMLLLFVASQAKPGVPEFRVWQ